MHYRLATKSSFLYTAIAVMVVIGFVYAPDLFNRLITATNDDSDTPNTTVSSPQPLAGFVWIKPNTFTMGSPEDEPYREDDETQYQVTLTEGFYLGEYEVTQEEYVKVMGVENPSYFKNARLPVETVSWYDAIDFCNRLSDQEHLPPYYDVKKKEVTIRGGEGYRLPTEAEWEYACRAGSEAAYCFGDDEKQLEQYAWFDKNSKYKLHPVGEKKPNGWGLYDMHGNVWEWCWDWSDPWSDDYPTTPQVDPSGPSKALFRVFRGGSWYSVAWFCRSAFRSRYVPEYRNFNLGFRLARSSVRQDQP